MEPDSNVTLTSRCEVRRSAETWELWVPEGTTMDTVTSSLESAWTNEWARQRSAGRGLAGPGGPEGEVRSPAT